MTVGDRDCEAGADDRALPGRELHALARREVEAGVAGVGTFRQDRVDAQPLDRQLDQRARCADSVRASATR